VILVPEILSLVSLESVVYVTFHLKVSTDHELVMNSLNEWCCFDRNKKHYRNNRVFDLPSALIGVQNNMYDMRRNRNFVFVSSWCHYVLAF
jgi:hypothetical protein